MLIKAFIVPAEQRQLLRELKSGMGKLEGEYFSLVAETFGGTVSALFISWAHCMKYYYVWANSGAVFIQRYIVGQNFIMGHIMGHHFIQM